MSLTAAPGTAAFCSSVTCPETVPTWLVWLQAAVVLRLSTIPKQPAKARNRKETPKRVSHWLIIITPSLFTRQPYLGRKSPRAYPGNFLLSEQVGGDLVAL